MSQDRIDALEERVSKLESLLNHERGEGENLTGMVPVYFMSGNFSHYGGARKTSPFRARMNSATAKPF